MNFSNFQAFASFLGPLLRFTLKAVDEKGTSATIGIIVISFSFSDIDERLNSARFSFTCLEYKLQRKSCAHSNFRV